LTITAHSDVLIVGAGSAGSVVAERVSADPACAVTLLEAGPGPWDPGVRALTDNGLQLPIGAASPVVTRFVTTLTERPERATHIVRGATVGGSGAVNGGYFCRASPRDFAEWDLPGWTWLEVLEHYRSIETDLDFAGPEHGGHGPVRVGRTRELVGCSARFRDAASQLGYRWIADLNAASSPGLPTGIGPVPLNIVDGIRIGPGAAFLRPALGRPNLTVLTEHRAQRIRFTGSRAVGVDVLCPDGAARLTADRIVLCAGAIGSAHLLMLSGVGEEGMLRAAGVAVALPAPVGLRCADHPEWVLPTSWSVAPVRPVLEVVLSTDDGMEIRPYTGGFVAMVGDGAAGHPDWPHLGVALMKPQSRGRISLVSADPAVPPRIEHRYDTVAADVAKLTAGVAVAREIARTATDVGEPQWGTSQHLCGSAPMGTATDPAAVTDPRCRLRGIDNLWVIDGSVMPSIPSRGPHATTVMLAHRAAGFVLDPSE
jgi:predicted dehydrogenase (TIGR03970 family)